MEGAIALIQIDETHVRPASTSTSATLHVSNHEENLMKEILTWNICISSTLQTKVDYYVLPCTYA